jgi:hypothetical protein
MLATGARVQIDRICAERRWLWFTLEKMFRRGLNGYGGDKDRTLLSNAVWSGDSGRGSTSGDGIGAYFVPSVICGHVQVLHGSGA